MSEQRLRFPTVALRGITILPGNVAHFDVSRQQSIKALDEAMTKEQKVFLVTQKDEQVDQPLLENLYSIGVVANVKQVIRMQGGLVRVLVEGISRARITELEIGEYLTAAVELLVPFDMEEYDTFVLEGMARSLIETFGIYATVNKRVSKDFLAQIMAQNDPVKIMELIAGGIAIPYQKKQKMLEANSFEEKFDTIQDWMVHETAVLQIKEEYQRKVKERVDKHQKEFIIREEIKVLSEELDGDTQETEMERFSNAIRQLDASDYVKDKLNKELRRLKNSAQSSSESGVIRSYIETMLELPWNKMSEDRKDLQYAKKVLDEDHYGLDKVKERILEFLAVRTLTSKADSQIICLVGPPGTGKTSIAKSIARALNKEYVRISLGGVRDEAEIRGHRRTYVGAMPGRLIDALRQAKVCNPLMLLDEIDKMGSDYRGDTASAMLEVLDSEQNCNFRDHYIEVPVDLSKVFFLATANSVEDIPRPLYDRMEIIEVSSYTENEKFHIAKEHLIRKQLDKNGLTKDKFTITDGALSYLIHFYTREAGVRTLERKIGQLCRKAAKSILMDDKVDLKVTKSNLKTILGKELYRFNPANEQPQIGVVRGLAWTSVGGDTLEVEVNVLSGKGELQLTGQLGDVMKESALAGLTCVRAIARDYGVEDSFFDEHDLHIHIPEGAVPKDGPSAGVTMATAMLSAVAGVRVKAEVAMTGEITLRGRVLAVGGLKEKILAAKNAGITTVCVPKKNEADILELSEEIVGGLSIHYLNELKDALKVAFVKDKRDGMSNKR